MPDLFTALKSYLDRHVYRIKGYLHPLDAMLFITLTVFQRKNNLAGSIAEIGVFFGRSFSLLAKSIHSGHEKAFAADLFDIGMHAGGESDQLISLRNTLKKAHIPASDFIIQPGDSAAIEPPQLLEKIGKIRFFSIDGGHQRHHVMTDSHLADQVLADYGVIVFDDFCNSEWPEVSLAVFDFLKMHEGRYVPFCLTGVKIYVCRKEYIDLYSKCIEDAPLWGGVEKRKIEFLGQSVFFCKQPIFKRMIYEAFARCGLGFAAGWLC